MKKIYHFLFFLLCCSQKTSILAMEKERQRCKSPNTSLKNNSPLYTKEELAALKDQQRKTYQELEKAFFYNRVNLEEKQKIDDNDFLQWIEQ